MDQIQPTSNMPGIVQVYSSVPDSKIQNTQIIQLSHPSLPANHEEKVTRYQQTITSEAISMPVTHVESQTIQTQIGMSCEQTHLQSMQPITMQSQILQADVNQPLQLMSHMILPHIPVFKQHMLLDPQQYYSQYNTYIKEQSFEAKNEVEPNVATVKEIKSESQPPSQLDVEVQVKCIRSRSHGPNPSNWACNVRKSKHQSGEAYISKRGKYVPERRIKSTKNCLTSCMYKCNNKICDSDRELIFKAFYSLNSNEKKQFLLNTTERHYVKQSKVTEDGRSKRQYSFKYFFSIRDGKYAVCKNFYLGTLAISQKPVYNVHANKSEMNIPKRDGRGLSASSINGLSTSIKDSVRNHIMSFKTMDSSPIIQFSRKKQYLNQNVSIKQMYTMYVSDCKAKNIFVVRESMYRKILKEEFNIVNYVKVKSEQLCAKCKEPIKKK